jgi:GrpB-like predicted nucleotidyltransferase (UPF0157 family)
VTAVLVVPYDPRWPRLFARARSELQTALGDAVVAIEHIGSTAVPGLAAKPIIDIMVGVDSLDRGRSLVDPVETLGYEYVPEGEAEMPFRRYFRRRDPTLLPGFERAGYHLHMVEAAHPFWTTHLAFRDHLRGSAEEARAYERLKLALAARHADDRQAYTDAKAPFVRAVLAQLGLS